MNNSLNNLLCQGREVSGKLMGRLEMVELLGVVSLIYCSTLERVSGESASERLFT